MATGSFSQIDTAHTQYIRMSPYAIILKNYSISRNDTFKEIWIMSTGWKVSIDFTTSNSKYVDSLKYYFGTSSISGSMEGGYTMNDTTVHNSTDMLGPIDIGLDRKVSVFLGRSGEHEYKVSLMLFAKDYLQRQDKFLDSVRIVDSATYGIGPRYGMPGKPKPFAARLLDSAMNVGMGGERRITDTERKQLAGQKINIINKAIKTDSSYLDAYELKFGWEVELKRYDSIILTGKKILNLASFDSAQVMYRIGECYELTGKIDSAKSYYQKALSLYEEQLSKMDKNDRGSNYEMSYKALVLILLNREQEGRAIYKELSESPMVNKFEKELYHNYLVTSRDDFLKKLDP
jgi:hypothetical protein